jgi:hypothetical protein
MRGRFPVSPIFSLMPVALRPRLRGGALSRDGQSALPRFARMGLPLHPSSPDLIRGSHKASKRSPGHGLATGPGDDERRRDNRNSATPPHHSPLRGSARICVSHSVDLSPCGSTSERQEARSSEAATGSRKSECQCVSRRPHGRAGGKQRLQPVNGPRGEERRSRDRDWTVSRTCSRKPITASLPSPLWGGAGGGGQTKQSARPLHPTAKTSPLAIRAVFSYTLARTLALAGVFSWPVLDGIPAPGVLFLQF